MHFQLSIKFQQFFLSITFFYHTEGSNLLQFDRIDGIDGPDDRSTNKAEFGQ